MMWLIVVELAFIAAVLVMIGELVSNIYRLMKDKS
jgi:hypothetical protein